MMADIGFLFVPYDSGFRSARMGKGPEAIRDSGLIDRLRAVGHDVTVETITVTGEFTPEIETAFALMREVSGRVSALRELRRFPIVCSGNCNVTVGTYAGLSGRPSLLWLDGHSDFATDDDTRSGFLDGMGASMLVGDGWQHMLAGVPGYRPLAGHRLVQCGVRHYPDDAVRDRLTQSGALVVTPEQCAATDPGTVAARIMERVDPRAELHIHLDVDVFDRNMCVANTYHPDGGLAPDFVHGLIGRLAGNRTVSSLNVASYDPAVDTKHLVLPLIETIVLEITSAVGTGGA
jgi:arginase